LQEIVTTLNKKANKTNTIAGTGLLTLDVIIDANKNRLFSKKTGGSTGNVLSIMSIFGWESYPVAYIGDDIPGNMIIRDLVKNDVKTNYIFKDSSIQTPIIIENLITNGNIDHEFKFTCLKCKNKLPRNRLIPKSIFTEILNKMKNSDIFYIDRLSVNGLELARDQKKKGAIIFFEPHIVSKLRLFKEILKITDILKYSKESIENIPFERSPRLEIQTLGDRGTNFCLNEDPYTKPDFETIPSFKITNSLDSTGSGDWVSSGLLYTIFNNNNSWENITKKDIVEAITFGQALAGINCHYIGAREMMYDLTVHDIISKASELITNGSLDYTAPEMKYQTLSESIICNKCR